MAQYKSYTDKTLYYIGHALYQINQTQRVFRNACRKDAIIRKGKNRHCNFPKWHVMSHYPEWIKCNENATGFTTGIEEVMHIIWINYFFKQTNMRKDYKRQILDYNVEKFSLMVRDDIDLISSTKILTQTNKNAALQVNSVTGANKIREELKLCIKRSERRR